MSRFFPAVTHFSSGSRRGSRGRRAAAGLVALTVIMVAVLNAATAPAMATDSCPNAAIRAQQGSERLAECRAYEQVTPVEKGNMGEATMTPPLISPDGNRIMFSGSAVLGDAPSLSSVTNPYVAERGPNGWTFHTDLLRPSTHMWNASGALPGEDLLPDLSGAIWAAQTIPQMDTDETQFYVSSSPRAWTAWSPLLTPLPGSKEATTSVLYRGGSLDLSRFVFSEAGGSTAHTRYLADDPTPVTSPIASRRGWSNLYLVTKAGSVSSELQLVNRNPDGSVIGPRCGATLGSVNVNSVNPAGTSSRHAVSADGTTIYYTARPAGIEPDRVNCSAAGAGADGPAPARIFARRDGVPATPVSESQCARIAPTCSTMNNVDDLFEGASVNGNRVFFTTTRQLTDSDLDTTKDLYAYDFDPPAGQPNLVQVSRGDDSAGSTAGNGAAVQGVLRFADDGSRAYFVAHGKLTDTANAHGQVAASGAKNLYVWQRDDQHPSGRIAYVATLAAGDSALWSINDTRAVQATPNTGVDGSGEQVGGDGRFLLFASAASLTAEAPGTAVDAFRYDDVTGEMTLVSPRAPDSEGDASVPVEISRQYNRVSTASYANNARSMSEDGSVIGFTTSRALVAEDRNDSPDVYMWHDDGEGGTVSLISGGTYVTDQFQWVGFGTMSPDGRDFTFVTPAGLLSQDVDGGGDIYNARVGGGFPLQVPGVVAPPCEGDACQGRETVPPILPGALTEAFAGPGNVAPPLGPKGPVAKPKVYNVKTVHGTSTRIRVKVPGKGKIRVFGSGVLRASKAVKKAGTYRATVKLSKRARRTLKRKHRVKLRLSVRFTPTGGKAVRVRTSVTFKPKAKKKVKASSRSVRRTGVLSSDAQKDL